MKDVTYILPDSVVVQRIKRSFSPDELHNRGRALIERERKFGFVALFYTLSLGLVAGSDCSIQGCLERFVDMAEYDELAYTSFPNRFSPTLVTNFREILNDRVRLRTARSCRVVTVDITEPKSTQETIIQRG